MSTATAVPQRTGVFNAGRTPWVLVSLTAAVLALADGFWIISLRGAVGSVEVDAHPFITWLRESMAALPAFAALTLVALTGVSRRRTAKPRRHAGSLAFARVVAAGTLAGAGWLAYQSARSYLEQIDELHMMQSLGSTCSVGPCAGRGESAVLALQVKAFGYGALILLVTNAMVMLWVIALRGRPLPLGAVTPRTTSPVSDRARPTDPIAMLLALLLIGTAAIHGAVVPEHLAEWPAAGWFFVALLVAELLAAASMCSQGLTQRRSTVRFVAAISVGPLFLWALSRSVGLPFGPAAWESEPVAVADVSACLLMLATLVLALGRLRERHAAPRSFAAGSVPVAVLVVLAVSCVGLAGTDVAKPSSVAPPAMLGHR